MTATTAWVCSLAAALALAVFVIASAGGSAIRWIPGEALTHWPGRRPRPAAVGKVMAVPARATRAASIVQLGATAVFGIALAILAALALRPDFLLAALAALVAAVLVQALVLFADPRQLGRRYPVPWLRLAAPILLAAMRLTAPVLRGIGPADHERTRLVPTVSGGQLLELVDRVTDADVLPAEERELVHSVVELGDTLTREVMVPRTDIVAIEAGKPLRKAMSLFIRSGFSRVPVIGEDADDVRGVLYLKDAVQKVQLDAAASQLPVDQVMRPALFVPESKPVDDLLRELQSGPSHLALVVDEYGGIAGLVTIEDVLEEIVGELTDEHDPAVPAVEDLGEGRYRVPARFELDELGELLGIEVDDEDVDTVGGLLSKALGKVPLPGASAGIGGIQIVADHTEGRRRRLATVIVSAVPGEDA